MIGKDDIAKLAGLARLDVPETELAGLAADVESILGYVSVVERESVGALPKKAGELRNVMREDRDAIVPGTHTEAMLGAAPKRAGDYIAVKNIFE